MLPPSQNRRLASQACQNASFRFTFGTSLMTSLNHIARAMIIGIMIMMSRRLGHGDVA
jgi:hypothetical protein